MLSLRHQAHKKLYARLPTLFSYNPHPSLLTSCVATEWQATVRPAVPKLFAEQRAKDRFGLFPFRSPLLRECASVKHWHCFLFLRVLRCFTSPGSRLIFLMSRPRFTRSGFPIRKSPDQRLLNTSPKLIAVTPRPSSPPTPKASTICP